MSDKLNVDMSFKAVGTDSSPDAFSAEMDIRYKNMSRSGFAGFEMALMDMFKGLAETQIEVTEVGGPKGAIR